MRHTSTIARLAGAVSMLTLTSVMAANPAQAAAPATSFEHFIECAGWLFSDPAQHAANCAPGHDVFVTGSTGHSADPENSNPG